MKLCLIVFIVRARIRFWLGSFHTQHHIPKHKINYFTTLIIENSYQCELPPPHLTTSSSYAVSLFLQASQLPIQIIQTQITVLSKC